MSGVKNQSPSGPLVDEKIVTGKMSAVRSRLERMPVREGLEPIMWQTVDVFSGHPLAIRNMWADTLLGYTSVRDSLAGKVHQLEEKYGQSIVRDAMALLPKSGPEIADSLPIEQVRVLTVIFETLHSSLLSPFYLIGTHHAPVLAGIGTAFMDVFWEHGHALRCVSNLYIQKEGEGAVANHDSAVLLDHMVDDRFIHAVLGTDPEAAEKRGPYLVRMVVPTRVLITSLMSPNALIEKIHREASDRRDVWEKETAAAKQRAAEQAKNAN